MKKRVVLSVFACTALVIALTACKEETSANAPVITSILTEEKAEPEVSVKDVEREEESVTADVLFSAFLKDEATVHFNNFQPEKFFTEGEYMFNKDDSVTFSELLSAYDRYYLEQVSYMEIYRNIRYAFIEAGDAGKKQLVIESIFPNGGNAQFVLEEANGQLEMFTVIESYYRFYATVINPYGLVCETGSYSYSEHVSTYWFLDENADRNWIYSVSYAGRFGQDSYYDDPLYMAAFEYNENVGFEHELVLETYSFMEYRPDFTPEEEEAYRNSLMYTVEYSDDYVLWHEDSMYEEGSVLDKIFDEAGYVLCSPEEIEAVIELKKSELNLNENEKADSEVEFTELTDRELGAVMGADVSNGEDELTNSLLAYAKYLENPVNMIDILSNLTISPNGEATPGLIFGFALRDVDKDEVPELIIDFGQPEFPNIQNLYIYKMNKENGMVQLVYHMSDAAGGAFVEAGSMEAVYRATLENNNPILFYDITKENIEKIVTKDYWDSHKGEEGVFGDYTPDEAYGYLEEKALWYKNLSIDDTYDKIVSYDYDEDIGETAMVFFDLDNLIQSHVSRQIY